MPVAKKKTIVKAKTKAKLTPKARHRAKPPFTDKSATKGIPHDREAQAFRGWLAKQGACYEAVDWAAGKTIQEACAQCGNPAWLSWLARHLGLPYAGPSFCACNTCHPGGADAVRSKVELPKRFPWQDQKKKAKRG